MLPSHKIYYAYVYLYEHYPTEILMKVCITLRITLRRSMYHFAYHVASHFIALYFILLVYHCVCESNSVGL